MALLTDHGVSIRSSPFCWCWTSRIFHIFLLYHYFHLFFSWDRCVCSGQRLQWRDSPLACSPLLGRRKEWIAKQAFIEKCPNIDISWKQRLRQRDAETLTGLLLAMVFSGPILDHPGWWQADTTQPPLFRRSCKRAQTNRASTCSYGYRCTNMLATVWWGIKCYKLLPGFVKDSVFAICKTSYYEVPWMLCISYQWKYNWMLSHWLNLTKKPIISQIEWIYFM